MGARATRISREEIVVPSDFADFQSKGDPTARVGGARIDLIRSGEETQLGYCYQQIPVRVLPPFVIEGEVASLLYLITLTAGLMDSDAHLFELNARKGTRGVVTGQSASRVHPALTSFATQQWNVDVEEDAILAVLPGPTIPFRGARFFQRGRVNLAASSRLLWGDIWLPGRYERGALSERFVFDRIVQDFEVRRAGALVYRDRFRWNGPWSTQEADWFFGGHLAAASLFVGGPMPVIAEVVEGAFVRSIFPLENGESCLRWCGHPTAITLDLVRVAMTIAGFWSGGKDGSAWLIESSGLSPNHWFSMLPKD